MTISSEASFIGGGAGGSEEDIGTDQINRAQLGPNFGSALL